MISRKRFAAVPALALCVLLGSAGALLAAEGERTTPLKSGWAIQSSAKVSAGGDAISKPDFKPDGWYPASVPTTVVAALVADHVYADPDFGLNLRAIPGTEYPIGANFSNIAMPADSPFRVPWWYRTEFELPAADRGKNLWLHFKGVNYRANVWLNGEQIASSENMVGTWRLFDFNVTASAKAGAANVLAVEVFPPTPDSLALTWVDWNPMPPDKDMGIWRGVDVIATGPIVLRHPQVITKVDLPSLDAAHLTLSADLLNATSEPVKGDLKASVGDVQVSQPVELAAGEHKVFTFAPDRFPALNLAHPRIWWPAQMGKPDLYDLKVQVDAGGQASDGRAFKFGVREITSEVDSEKHRLFSVNGKRILIRGGGWSPDMLLRLDPKREEDEILYTRDMGLNTIRLEGKMTDDHLFDLADRYGILILTGWCCCDHWERWRTWSDADYSIAEASLRDQLDRLRNHPSVLAWLYGSDNPPPPRVEALYLKALKDESWPGPYISSASARPTTIGPSGVKMTGPYEYVAPSYWIEDTDHGGAYGFNTETSPGPAPPVIESIREMLPAKDLWPINDAWDYHAGGGEFKNLNVFNRALEARYGKPTGLEDYLEKAQLMTYAGERAMYEAYSQNKYHSTGVIQWMENNAWPSLIWHLYDWYLRPGGGYFGTKKACEPVHIQYSENNGAIVVVNSTYEDHPGLHAKAEVFNLDLTRKFSKEATLDVTPDSTNSLFLIPKIEGLSETYFVRLELTDASGKVLSRNFYWRSTKPDVSDWANSTWYYTPLSAYANYTALSTLPKVKLEASSTDRTEGDETLTEVTLKNPTSHLAFFVHLEIFQGNTAADVHSIRWEDNYVSLMPGESREIAARYRTAELNGAKPVVRVDGWNVGPSEE
jgi:exo-1,4-beta-D-glucosaminidase